MHSSHTRARAHAHLDTHTDTQTHARSLTLTRKHTHTHSRASRARDLQQRARVNLLPPWSQLREVRDGERVSGCVCAFAFARVCQNVHACMLNGPTGTHPYARSLAPARLVQRWILSRARPKEPSKQRVRACMFACWRAQACLGKPLHLCSTTATRKR